MSIHGLRLNFEALLIARKMINPFERVFEIQTSKIILCCNSCLKDSAIVKEDDCITKPLKLNPKINALIEHWKYGRDIRETLLPEIMLQRIRDNGGEYKGLRNLDDVYQYYQELDKVFERVRHRGLDYPDSPSCILEPFSMNGITLNISKDLQLIFAGRGTHRLAMAIAASLKSIPVYFRRINATALEGDNWRKIIGQS